MDPYTKCWEEGWWEWYKGGKKCDEEKEDLNDVAGLRVSLRSPEVIQN